MPDYRDFDKIDQIIRIEGTLTNETPLRIGVGREAPLGSAVDIAVYRVEETPIIPGSSLKGVFRAYIESIAPSFGIDVHQPWDTERIEEEARERDGEADFCPICGIFGNTKLASHIRVYDAKPKDPSKARVFVKTGIGIDRVFGAVKPGIGPFKEEFLNPGIEWELKIDIINIPLFPKPADIRGKLILSLLDALKNLGLNIGARKSIGAGSIKLKEAKYTIYSIKNGRMMKIEEGEI